MILVDTSVLIDFFTDITTNPYFSQVKKGTNIFISWRRDELSEICGKTI